MARNATKLPSGWEKNISTESWPKAFIDAVRQDVSILTSQRAIDTIRAWQDDSTSESVEKRKLGRSRLRELSDALLNPIRPPKKSHRLASITKDTPSSNAPSVASQSQEYTTNWPTIPLDSRITPGLKKTTPTPSEAPSSNKQVKVSSEHPTDTHLLEAAQKNTSKVIPRAPSVIKETQAATQGDETTPVATLQELKKRQQVSVDKNKAAPEAHKLSKTKDLLADSLKEKSSMPPVESKAFTQHVKHRQQSHPAGTLTRAATSQVHALYSALWPLSRELIPLPYERRSRRFWARWREVTGDRGIHPDYVEQLLQSADDAQQLVAALIAELQSAQYQSVYTLISEFDMATDQFTLDGLSSIAISHDDH